MAWRKKSSKLDKEISRLVRLFKKSYQPDQPRRTAFNPYLEAVLNLYWRWKKKDELRARRKELATHLDQDLRHGKRVLHLLIEASSKRDPGIQSRWARALIFCSRNVTAIRKEGFDGFVDRHGGISGCAGQMAKRQKNPARKKRKMGVPK